MPLPRVLLVRSWSRPLRMNSSNDAPDSAPRIPPVTFIGIAGSSNASGVTPSAFTVSSTCASLRFQSALRGGSWNRRRQIADAQLADVEIGVPVERQIDHAQILFVGPRDRVEDERAVLDRPAQRPEPILRPRQRHRAVAADAAEGRPQAGHAADRRRAQNRAAGFGADAERDATGGGRARRTGRRSARSLGRIPRAVGAPAEPLIARRELSGRQLREHDRARLAQQAHHRRLGVDHLSFEGARSPLRRKSGDRDDVLAPPRHAVQRPAVLPGRDLLVGLLRLLHRQFVGVGDDEVERGVEAAETIEIHARELDRRHLTRLEQLREVRERPERDVFEVGGTAQRRRRARAEWLRRAIEPRARHDRAEVQRRRDVRSRSGSAAAPRSASGSG